MNDCIRCKVEKECYYPYKVCDCVHQRKFWDKKLRKIWDKQKLTNHDES
jgi:hypothetical protein